MSADFDKASVFEDLQGAKACPGYAEPYRSGIGKRRAEILTVEAKFSGKVKRRGNEQRGNRLQFLEEFSIPVSNVTGPSKPAIESDAKVHDGGRIVHVSFIETNEREAMKEEILSKDYCVGPVCINLNALILGPVGHGV